MADYNNKTKHEVSTQETAVKKEAGAGNGSKKSVHREEETSSKSQKEASVKSEDQE